MEGEEHERAILRRDNGLYRVSFEECQSALEIWGEHRLARLITRFPASLGSPFLVLFSAYNLSIRTSRSQMNARSEYRCSLVQRGTNAPACVDGDFPSLHLGLSKARRAGMNLPPSIRAGQYFRAG
jgi:hypothetical protein